MAEAKRIGALDIDEGGVGGTDEAAIHDDVSGEINAITEKTTPVGADLLLIEDSAASNAKKKVQITNLPGGGGGGAATGFDVARFKTYTLSDTPNATYPEMNLALNGTSHVGILTSPGEPMSEEQGFAQGYLGWRDADVTGDLTIRVDLGSAEDIGRAEVVGYWETGQQIYHPSKGEVDWSDNDTDWTSWGTDLSSLSDNPGSLGTAMWAMEFSAAAASHRYWRFIIGTPSPGSGDNWTFIARVHLYLA